MKKPLQTSAKEALHTVASQLGIVLNNVKYYASYLDAEEVAVIEQAIHQKSRHYQWNLLRCLALKIFTALQSWPLLQTEPSLKRYSAKLETDLMSSDDNLPRLRVALEKADVLFAVASLRRSSSHNTTSSVASNSSWSAKILTTCQSLIPSFEMKPLKGHSTQLERDSMTGGVQRLHFLSKVTSLWRAAFPSETVSAVVPDVSWSASQDRQYDSVQRAYCAHNDALTASHNQVEELKEQWRQLIGSYSSEQQTWKPVRREIPEEFLDYQPSARFIRLSDQNISRLISTTGDKRAIYQDLKAQLAKPPTPEKISEQLQSAQLFLHYKAEAIVHNAQELRRCIVQKTQQMITHRTQVKLEHADKIERLSMALGNLIQLLQSYRLPNSQEPEFKELAPLSQLLTEAKTLQTKLEKTPLSLTATMIEEKLLSWDMYRQRFAQTIPTGWMNFFSSDRRARAQQEKQLHAKLQSALAHLVTPLYGFNNHAALIPPQRIQQACDLIPTLDQKQTAVRSEQKKTAEIKNTFAR